MMIYFIDFRRLPYTCILEASLSISWRRISYLAVEAVEMENLGIAIKEHYLDIGDVTYHALWSQKRPKIMTVFSADFIRIQSILFPSLFASEPRI